MGLFFPLFFKRERTRGGEKQEESKKPRRGKGAGRVVLRGEWRC